MKSYMKNEEASIVINPKLKGSSFIRHFVYLKNVIEKQAEKTLQNALLQ